MTHTEESLMSLAAVYGVIYAAGQQGGWNELRLAIREVLAERDRLRKQLELSCDDARGDPEATACPVGYKLVKAEAEVERLKAGGCARNQGLTQYCAEAEALRKDAERKQKLLDDAEAVLIRQRDARKKVEAECERLQNLLFARGAMNEPPCFACGYNGPGYYQPSTHECAARHHAALKDQP